MSVRNMDKTLVGNLRLGLIDHAPTRPDATGQHSIAAFRKRSEAVRFSIAVRPPRDLEEQLIQGELDLVFSYFWRHLPSMEYKIPFQRAADCLLRARASFVCQGGCRLPPRKPRTTSGHGAVTRCPTRTFTSPRIGNRGCGRHGGGSNSDHVRKIPGISPGAVCRAVYKTRSCWLP